MEDHFYCGDQGSRIFSRIYHAEVKEENMKPGILFCEPFAEEKLWAQRVLVNFARILAGEGYTVMRFDYRGHGDSDGAFEDSTVETRLDDIGRAVEILQQKTHVERVGLFGLRLGATLGVLWAEKNKSIDALILWEPVLNVEKYLVQCLRSNLTFQTSIYRKIKYTREQMIQDLQEGRPVNIDGYLMPGEFYQQASDIDLNNISTNYLNPVYIAHIARIKKEEAPDELVGLHQKYFKNNPSSKLEVFQEDPFWSDTKKYYQFSKKLFNGTLDWLEKISNE